MRIVTWNIRAGLGMDNRRDIARIGEALRALSPDAVCLQEVHRFAWGGGGDQPAAIARAIGRHVTFRPSIRMLIYGFGVAIATREPPEAVVHHPLPSRGEPRSLLHVVTQAEGGARRHLFCTHWGLDPGERIEQAAACAEAVRNAGGSALFCGDLNEEREDRAVRTLIEGTGLADAGPVAPTYPAVRPAWRIDFVLASPGLRAARAEVVHSEASDHRPVLADIEAAAGCFT